MILAIKHPSSGLGLSVSDKGTDDWCGASTELTQFFSDKEARAAMAKFGLKEPHYQIIPHPNQKARKKKDKQDADLRKPTAPKFK